MTTGMPGRSPSSAPGHRLQLADHGVGGHDARELAQRGTGQLAHRVAVEVVEPAARGEGGVGHHLVGQAVDDEVAGREDDVGRLEALGLVLGQPGQLGRHRAGVERDPGAGPVDVVAPHALGQPPRLGRGRGGRTTRCPCRSGRPAAVTGTKVCRAPEQATTSTSAERGRRLGPGLGAGDDHRGPPAQRVLLGPADLGVGRGQLGARQRHQAVVAPQADLGDGGPEVDGEDHRPCTSASTRPAISAGSGSW